VGELRCGSRDDDAERQQVLSALGLLPPHSARVRAVASDASEMTSTLDLRRALLAARPAAGAGRGGRSCALHV